MKRRFRDVMKENMKLVGVRKEDAEDRTKWRQMIRYVDPNGEKPKVEMKKSNNCTVYRGWTVCY